MMHSTDEKAVAEKLLQCGAVHLRPAQPYTWASGWKSPVYCDNRRLLSFPYIRDFIKSELCNVIFEQFPQATLLAGVATAGIAWGAMAADQMKLPFAYVRPKPKEHGLGNQVEGLIEPGKKILVVEDLISTGKSSLQVVEVLRSLGHEVCGMVSIFNYGFAAADHNFMQASVPLVSLTRYNALIARALERGDIQEDMLPTLESWRQAPQNWMQ